MHQDKVFGIIMSHVFKLLSDACLHRYDQGSRYAVLLVLEGVELPTLKPGTFIV
jgi:hypothetical protein